MLLKLEVEFAAGMGVVEQDIIHEGRDCLMVRMARMVPIERNAIAVETWSIAEPFDASFVGIVALFAKALQFAGDEYVPVAFVGDDVVGDRGFDRNSALQVKPT
jgi:hypothetical protein